MFSIIYTTVNNCEGVKPFLKANLYHLSLGIQPVSVHTISSYRKPQITTTGDNRTFI